MQNYHYSRTDFELALQSVGICKGDTVFCHSNVGYLGYPEGVTSKQQSLELILSTFLNLLGSQGTLVVPTFTYSFGKGENFNVNDTASDCGMFSEYIRTNPLSVRSNDPSVSVSAIGKYASFLTNKVSENAYDEGSAFSRLVQLKAKVLNINFDAGSTLLHFFERVHNVSYRFDKTFHGKKFDGKSYIPCKSTLWVRDLNIEGSQASFERFNRYATDKGIYKRAKVGRGGIGCISVEDMNKAFSELYEKDPWFLTDKHI